MPVTSTPFQDLAISHLESFDKECGKVCQENFSGHQEYWWFLLARTALWGLFALIEVTLQRKQ